MTSGKMPTLSYLIGRVNRLPLKTSATAALLSMFEAVSILPVVSKLVCPKVLGVKARR